MTEFGVDYNWEHAGENAEIPFVSCVSLGSHCGVAACLNSLELRHAAFPFDWNRTSMQGIVHFFQTGFADFLTFSAVRSFPESKSSGGKMFSGSHHSVWHEDCSTVDGIEKYERRICRLLQNTAGRILFVRCMNTNIDVTRGEELLSVLSRLFPGSSVYLLLIADCQPFEQTFFVEGTEDRLLVHCVNRSRLGTLDYGFGFPVYRDVIAFAYKCASGIEDAEACCKIGRVRSCGHMFSLLAPFFSGDPTEVPWTPSFSPAPCYLPVNLRADSTEPLLVDQHDHAKRLRKT